MVRSAGELELRKKFEHSFREYFKPLCFYAMSFMKEEEVAKDIVHDVFLTVWSHRFEVDFSQPIYPYLLSLARNRSLNYLEHLKVKACHEEQVVKFGDVYVSVDDTEHEELISKIMERINTLPDRCKEVMYLYLVECKKYKEIAEMLNISVNTVKTHITNGLKILRNEFSAALLLFAFRI